MKDDDEKLRHAIALFRYGRIADLLDLEGPKSGLYAKLMERSRQPYVIPGSQRTKVAAETMRDWMKAYRKGGFDALMPKPRVDAGGSRRIPQSVQDILLDIKERNLDYSVTLVIREARKHSEVPEKQVLAPSTVHRLLSRHGLMKKDVEEPHGKDHRHFEFPYAGDLWMSDVMHGPTVLVDGRKRKTYLIAFLDDATRIIPFARFALGESNTYFLPTMKQALMRRGIPKRLFVDNGAAFRSQHLALVAAKLGITLIHARVRHPQAKGKQERWFRTVRTQFLPLVKEVRSLEALDQQLWAWVETEYHRTPHRGLSQDTPEDRWYAVGDQVRYPGSDLDDLFLFETKRKVRKDRTVSLRGQLYEVEAVLVDETVTLRYDPSAQKILQVWHQGRRHENATVVDVRANCHVKRRRPPLSLADLGSQEDA